MTNISKPLLHPPSHGPQIPIHLARRLAQNERDDGLLGQVDRLEPAEDVYLGVGKHNPRATRILYRELGFAILAGDAADGAGERVTLQDLLDVLDFKGLDVEVV